MVHRLVFGNDVVPGSSAIADQILRIESRQDIAKFAEDVRSRATGGLPRRPAEDYDTISRKYLKRMDLEEAAAFAFINRSPEFYGCPAPGKLDEVLKEAYNDLGFVTGLGSYKWGGDKKPIRTLDFEELQEHLDALWMIDFSGNYDQQLFKITHLHVFVQFNDFEAEDWLCALMACSEEVFEMLLENKTFLPFLKNSDISTMSSDRLRFFIWFIRLLAELAMETQECEPNVLKYLTSQQWFLSFINDFGHHLVSDAGCKALATMPVREADGVYGAWLTFARFLYDPFCKVPKPPKFIRAPFNCFEFNCKLLTMALFTGSRLAITKDPFTSHNANGGFHSILGVINRTMNLNWFKQSISQLSDNHIVEAIDMFALMTTIYFREWRFGFLKNGVPDKAFACLTHGSQFDVMNLASYILIMQLKASDRFSPSAIYSHTPLLISAAKFFKFVAEKFEKLNKDGVEFYWSSVLNMAVLGQFATKPSDMRELAQYEPFVRMLTLAIGSSFQKTYFLPAEKVKPCLHSIVFLANLAFATKPNMLTLVLADPKVCDDFTLVSINPSHWATYYPFKAYATLLLSLDEKLRKYFISDFGPQIVENSVALFEYIVEKTNQIACPDLPDRLLAFECMLTGKPDLSSFDEILIQSKYTLLDFYNGLEAATTRYLRLRGKSLDKFRLKLDSLVAAKVLASLYELGDKRFCNLVNKKFNKRSVEHLNSLLESMPKM